MKTGLAPALPDERKGTDDMTRDFASDALRRALKKRMPGWAQALLWALASAVFYAFALNARYARMEEFASFRLEELTRLTAVVYTGIFAVSLAVQMRVARGLESYMQVLLALLTGLILLGKISLLDYVSDDYSIFLSNWIYDYSQMSLRQGLGWYIGTDYTPPYLYLLQIISRVDSYPWQYLVKAVSIFTEILLAYTVMKIAGLRVRGTGAQLLIFHIASILPTVVFNGAYWAQCDAIYVSFCLLGLYLGLTGRGARSMMAFGVALSFKLQTVFFLPVLLPLWLRRDVKLRHVLLIPAFYMIMMIPALWGGKSLNHVLTAYIKQADQYSYITMNGPSLYHLMTGTLSADALYEMFGAMAILLAFALVLALCVLVSVYRDRLTDEAVVLSCLLMLSGVPFFLPKMHERYTFGADVLALAAAAYRPRRIALPLLFGLASYICYTAGLPGDNLMDLKWATMFQGAGVALTAAALWHSLHENKEAIGMEVKA